jgi:hypothetical protein
MAKYCKKIVKRICSLLEKDNYTITEICTIIGIAEATFYDWQKKKIEFSEEIKKAKDKYNEMIVIEAKNSLRKKVMGYDVEESQTVWIDSKNKDGETKPKIKEKKIIKKHIQPDTVAIIFTLTNKDPENWKNKQSTEINGELKTNADPINISIINTDQLPKSEDDVNLQ